MSGVYSFHRGETIRLCLDAISGDPESVTGVTAQLRKRRGNVLTGSEPVAGTFAVSERAATVDYPAGWDLALPPSVTSTLAPGLYSADARLAFGADDAQITESWTIEIKPAASAP